MMPMFDGSQWNDWLPTDDGRLVELHPVDLGMGQYLAHAAARADDIHFAFVEKIWQQLSFPKVARATASITEDMRNLGTSLAKVDLFWNQRESVGRGVADFARTETEYTLIVARSLLDHLHEVVRGIWAQVQLQDETQQRAKKQRGLPEKLSKTCLSGANVRTAAELSAAYALPEPLAAAYSNVGAFVRDVRLLRDGIVHHGNHQGPVFVTERGFGIGRGDRLARALPGIWRDAHQYNENVVSLRPLLAHVAIGSLYCCDAMTDAVAACIQLLPPIAPGFLVFTRFEHASALLRAQDVTRGGDAWWPPSIPTVATSL